MEEKNCSRNSSVEIQLIQLQMPSRNVLSCSNLICLTISVCFSTLVAHGDCPNIYYLLSYMNGYLISVNFTSLYALIVHISYVCTISSHLRIQVKSKSIHILQLPFHFDFAVGNWFKYWQQSISHFFIWISHILR